MRANSYVRAFLGVVLGNLGQVEIYFFESIFISLIQYYFLSFI